jgi:hypothetical protein
MIDFKKYMIRIPLSIIKPTTICLQMHCLFAFKERKVTIFHVAFFVTRIKNSKLNLNAYRSIVLIVTFFFVRRVP